MIAPSGLEKFSEPINIAVLAEAVKGIFISMPSNSYKKDGQTKHNEICHPITAEARNELIDRVTEAYEAKLSEEQDMDDLSEDETADIQPSM